MPRVRALVIVIACAIGAVLGMGAFALAQVASGCGGSSGPALTGSMAWGGVGCEERLGAAVAPDAAVPGGSARGVPASTATRHIPAPGEHTGRRGENPATDRAMALLIGWGTLVLICGGLCCGRRRPEAEPGAVARAPEVRVRVSGPRSGAPRHLLATPPHRTGRRDRPGLSRALACLMAPSWRDPATGRGPVRASAVAGPGMAADVAVAGRGTSLGVGRAAEVGDTVVMRRIVLGGSAAPAAINGRRR